LGIRLFNRLPVAFAPMSTQQFLTSAWKWNTAVLLLSGVAIVAYVWAFGVSSSVLYLIAGLGVFVLTLFFAA